MYRRILITGRADCAARLIRACHDENVQAFIISAKDDVLSSVHEMADGVVFTGFSRDAYTSQDDILEAARYAGCEAILPGWGFLSEDYSFARKCRLMGLHFIGPSSRQLQIFGDKLKTIQALEGRIPDDCIPCSVPDARQKIAEMPGPWMLKGRFGGGGKEIERFDDLELLNKRLDILAETSALSMYYVERAIDGASHIEFQVFGDGRGNVQILGARDCTPQRHHQKYLEKSLEISTLSENLIQTAEKMREQLSQMKYLSWGTIEFLVQPDGRIHLLELNPRLQVEHGVTEMTAGIDLVRSAIRLSCTETLDLCKIPKHVHAIEYRLFAEKAGAIKTLGFAGHPWPESEPIENADYRIESGYMPGDRITGVYDGLVARFMLSTDESDIDQKLENWLKHLTFEMV